MKKSYLIYYIKERTRNVGQSLGLDIILMSLVHVKFVKDIPRDNSYIQHIFYYFLVNHQKTSNPGALLFPFFPGFVNLQLKRCNSCILVVWKDGKEAKLPFNQITVLLFSGQMDTDDLELNKKVFDFFNKIITEIRFKDLYGRETTWNDNKTSLYQS